MEALDEAIRIGKGSGVRVEVSHLKAMGKDNWGRGKEALLKLEKARRVAWISPPINIPTKRQALH